MSDTPTNENAELDALFAAYEKQYHGGDQMTDVLGRIGAIREIVLEFAKDRTAELESELTTAQARIEQLERENAALRANTSKSVAKRLDVQLREP